MARAKFLPEHRSGRGTMRSMVEGQPRSGVFAAAPSTAVPAVPLPVPGRIAYD
jgi:hypothetical protein